MARCNLQKSQRGKEDSLKVGYSSEKVARKSSSREILFSQLLPINISGTICKLAPVLIDMNCIRCIWFQLGVVQP